MRRATKKRISGAIGLVLLSPLLPFAGIILLLRAAADGIEWCFDDQPWTKFLVRQSERVERALGVDAETEYREWQERMSAKREAAHDQRP